MTTEPISSGGVSALLLEAFKRKLDNHLTDLHWGLDSRALWVAFNSIILWFYEIVKIFENVGGGWEETGEHQECSLVVERMLCMPYQAKHTNGQAQYMVTSSVFVDVTHFPSFWPVKKPPALCDR